LDEPGKPEMAGVSEDPVWLASRPVLIFDLGGVVLDWNPRYLFRQLIPDDETREWFLTEVCSPAWNLQMDFGQPSAAAVATGTGGWKCSAAPSPG
jgi:hypothetical protein